MKTTSQNAANDKREVTNILYIILYIILYYISSMYYHTINFEVKSPKLLYMYYFYVIMHRLHDRRGFFLIRKK